MDYSSTKTKHDKKYNLNKDSNLEYYFPSFNDIAQVENTFKETNISKNLKLGNNSYIEPPKRLKYSIGKVFGDKLMNNPLQDILLDHKQKISHYQLSLPFSKPKESAKNSISKDRTKKRIRQPKYEVDKENVCSTPISKRQQMPSPSVTKSKRTNITLSTPVTTLGLMNENKINISDSRQKKMTNKKLGKKRNKEKNTDYDNLACHADNIMRMAVDSTMLGSTFSFSFSNTFNDSTVMLSKKKGEYDIYNEDDEGDRSVLEILRSKRKNGLNKLKAFKIDINAEDLQAAVNDEDLI